MSKEALILNSYPNPDYIELVRFLIQPLLDVPESLRIDCEELNHNRRVWIRLAFDNSEKGRVYGRGGRNLQAIRKVLNTAAHIAGQSLYLDIYEEEDRNIPTRPNNNPLIIESNRRKPRSRRPEAPKKAL